MSQETTYTKSPGAVIAVALKKSTENLQLSADEVQSVLGCSLNELTILCSPVNYSFTNSSMRRAVYFLRIYKALAGQFCNDKQTMQEWMRRPNLALKKTPLAFLDSEKALEQVIACLEQH